MGESNQHSDLIEQVRIYLTWVPPDHAAAATRAIDRLEEQLESAQHERDENRQIINSEREYIGQLKEQLESAQHERDENRQIINSEREYIGQLKEQLEAERHQYVLQSGLYVQRMEEIGSLSEQLQAVHQLVEAQAKDDGLWFIAKTAPEAYLQQELRHLHAFIEGRTFVPIPPFTGE